MCFSATASFTVSALAGGIGAAALKHTTSVREMPLAGIPLLFGAQQLIEGVLWLQLAEQGSCSSIATLSVGFLTFAEVIWPAYIALAVLLVEPSGRRRQVLISMLLIGLIISHELLLGLIIDPPTASIRGRSISYGAGTDILSWEKLPYLTATVLPLFVSSHGPVRTFGVFVAGGFLVSALLYAETFISIWCFFAAASSVVLCLHFRRVARAGTNYPYTTAP